MNHYVMAYEQGLFLFFAIVQTGIKGRFSDLWVKEVETEQLSLCPGYFNDKNSETVF